MGSLSTWIWGLLVRLVASVFGQKSLVLGNEKRSFQPSAGNSYSALHISFHGRIPPSQIQRHFSSADPHVPSRDGAAQR